MNAGILVGINVWNQLDEAAEAFRSYRESREDSPESARFLVVDDASPDARVEAHFRPLAERGLLHYHRNPRNLGLTRSWNALLHFAVSGGFAFVAQSNSDVRFPAGWLERFVAHLRRGCEYLLPVTNNPGLHGNRLKLHPQDVRNYVPGFSEGPDAGACCRRAMEALEPFREPVQLPSGNGFFIGFRVDFLKRITIREGEYWSESPPHLAANKGVGGDESEIRKRTGTLPWLARDVYIHHNRPYNRIGNSRREFLAAGGARER